MRRIVLNFLFCCTFCTGVYAQDGGLQRDSLPVFVIQDQEFASIVDDFIDKAKKIDNHTSAAFNISITLSDIGLTDEIHLWLNLREQCEFSDSLTFYKNPHSHQAFILHRNVLFRANIDSYATSFNYHLLTEMLKVLPKKQSILLKAPPPEFYDLNRSGGNPLEDTILESFHEYDGKKWFHGINIIDDYELEISDHY